MFKLLNNDKFVNYALAVSMIIGGSIASFDNYKSFANSGLEEKVIGESKHQCVLGASEESGVFDTSEQLKPKFSNCKISKGGTNQNIYSKTLRPKTKFKNFNFKNADAMDGYIKMYLDAIDQYKKIKSDYNSSTGYKNKLNQNLEDVNGLKYVINEESKTATIEKCMNKEIKEVVIPYFVINNEEQYEVTTIDEYAFCGCRSLSMVILPEGLKSIGNCAFQNCVMLEYIKLPSNLTNIGYYAFCGCSMLQSIELPDAIRNLCNGTFCDCENLKSVHLSKLLNNIGYGVFEGCRELKSVDIPDSVYRIGRYAFKDCDKLEEVKLSKNVRIQFDSFSNDVRRKLQCRVENF